MRLLKRAVKAVTRPRYAASVALQEMLYRPRLSAALDRAGGVGLLATLTGWSIERGSWQSDRDTVLVLDRLYFAKDVVQLRRLGTFNYPILQTHVLSVSQANWLPAELQEQISYWSRTRPEHAAAWAQAEAYAEQVLDQACRAYSVKAVLASNVDYWQHESFRRACTRMGLPFLVLCQEQQTVPFTYSVGVDLYRNADFNYTGAGVAVFEGRTRDMLVEANCCTLDQVTVTGAPRLDPWFDGSVATAVADSITLLAFDGEQYFAPECYLDALTVFADASLVHHGSSLEFVLKCKDAEDVRRALGHLSGREHRLTITHDRPLTDVFPRSRMVMGYNTLAILEALLSQAEIVVPAWLDADRPREQQIVDTQDPALLEHYRVVRSAAQWRAVIDEAVSTPRPPVNMAARRKLVRRWFYVPADGCASRAVEDFIRAHIAPAHECAAQLPERRRA